MSGQTNSELKDFLNSDDNKDQLLNINQDDNIKEIYVLSKTNTSLVSNNLDIFFNRINDPRGINNIMPPIETVKLKNNDSTIKVPPPKCLVVYLTKSQLDELNKNNNIKDIMDDAGKIEIDNAIPDRDNKIIKNIKYEIIGKVYSGKFKSNSYKISDRQQVYQL